MSKSPAHSTQKSTNDPAPQRASPDPAYAPAVATNELTQLLLDLLRNVNSEVKTTLALDGRAQAAVAHFQAISLSLRTLADGPTSSFSGGRSTTT